MNILLTGGTGFIGSHIAVELLDKDYDVIIVDNLINSKKEVIDRIHTITKKTTKFYQIDICNETELNKVFKENRIDAVIHLAGLKAVGESVIKPIDYYLNNLLGALTLTRLMNQYGVKKLIFSSSATLYGKPETVPIFENFPLKPTNPYGQTKLMQEQIFRDLYESDKDWNITLLRYFNPIGAHKGGLIGESPIGIPNNLVPYLMQVANGKRKSLDVFGNDYNTPDGTGVRDYIHVVDLAIGHIKALEKMNKAGIHIFNLGTGIGSSVLEIIETLNKILNRKIPYTIKPRRFGDIDICYANADKALIELNWKTKYNLIDMLQDAWNFQSKNSD